MKTIIKNQHPPVCLAQQPAEREWSAFKGTPCHIEVGDALRNEQMHLCCYCESEVYSYDVNGVHKDNCHIEHLVPRSLYNNLTYDYANLAISCNGGVGANATRHCGKHKENDYDVANFSSPHESATVRLFRYLSNGVILPTDGLSVNDMAKAGYLIGLLNLNCPRLVGMRNTYAKALLNMLGMDADEEMRKLVEGYLIPDTSGKLKNFPSIAYMALGC